MPQYLSPGVYVEEIPSAVQAIAGVGTSTAGFIGIVPDTLTVPGSNPYFDPSKDAPPEIEIVPSTVKLVGVTLAEEITLDNGDKLAIGSIVADQTQAEAITTAMKKKLKIRRSVEEAEIDLPTANKLVGVTLAEDVDLADGQKFAAGGVVADAAQAKSIINALTAAGKTKLKITKASDSIGMDVTTADDLIGVTLDEDVNLDGGETVAAGTTVAGKTQSKSVFAALTGAGKTKLKIKNERTIVPELKDLMGVMLAETVDLGDGNQIAANSVVIDKGQAASLVRVLDAASKKKLKIKNTSFVSFAVTPVEAGMVKLCTNFGEFKKHFGDFSTDPRQKALAHAVYGFFHNGGTRCYVARAVSTTDIRAILEEFGAVDEIALVAAPGITDADVRSDLVTHCAIATQDRFAILDSDLNLPNDDLTLLDPSNPANILPDNSDYAAFYFPWIKVFDPATKFMNPQSDGQIFVPPSGHVAGIYARTDTTRGVHKAPANAPVMGALGLRYQISKAQQDGLNPQGVNCIRDLNGNIRVWGARTVGGSANGEWRYINVRRTFLFLRESIDEGMQWAVFEPNDQNLWAKIKLNVSAFLTTVWRSGALFGSTAQEAFYVKCDAETNPPELREIGQVVTEIGVAVVRPAEFVIFRISQWQPQPGS